METFSEINAQINRSMTMEESIQKSLACYQACMSSIPHCLSLGGKHSEADHIALMMECAEICRVSAMLMTSHSNYAHELCGICSRVCLACAKSCEEIAAGDYVMQECIEACRSCADACQMREH